MGGFVIKLHRVNSPPVSMNLPPIFHLLYGNEGSETRQSLDSNFRSVASVFPFCVPLFKKLKPQTKRQHLED